MFCGEGAIEVGACECESELAMMKSGLEAWCFARELARAQSFATLVIERLDHHSTPVPQGKRYEADSTTVSQHASGSLIHA